MPRFGPRKLALSGWHYCTDSAHRVRLLPTHAASSNWTQDRLPGHALAFAHKTNNTYRPFAGEAEA